MSNRIDHTVFALTSLREDRILLDKDGAFQAFQQALAYFRWEPLQVAANEYASWHLMCVAERTCTEDPERLLHP